MVAKLCNVDEGLRRFLNNFINSIISLVPVWEIVSTEGGFKLRKCECLSGRAIRGTTLEGI